MKHWSLLNLEIIGFASVLETPTLPRVLAPVFRDRANPEVIVLPPFNLVVDEVFNATQATIAEMEAFVDQGRMTRLAPPIPASINHDLWVNAEGLVAYQPKAEVKKAFDTLFTEHLALAEQGLKAKDYAGAKRHAAIARAVRPVHIDPLVIRAAAERLSGELSQVAFTRHIASSYLSAGEFDRLVDDRTRGEPLAEKRGSDVMKGIALRKPRLLAA